MIELDNIYNMDCLDGMKQIASDSVDLTVTSPPYDNLRTYNGYCFDFENIAKELYRVTKQGGVVVWVVKDGVTDGFESLTSFRQAIGFDNVGLKLYDTMIWEKQSAPNPTTGRYYDVFEYMFIFSKGKPKTMNFICDHLNISAGKISPKDSDTSNPERRRQREGVRICPEYSRRTNIWQIAVGQNETDHPAIFPEILVRDHINSWSNEGDIVLDPFMGSGTTAKVARALNRHYIGFEISAEYCDIIRKRLEQTKTLFDE